MLLLKTIEEYTLKLNKYLGYDFNTVEFAVRNGVPIAIDFCNPAPDAGEESVGAENFEWVVETAATYAIEKAKAQKFGQDNLTWGEYVKTSAAGTSLTGKSAAPKAKAAPAVKAKASTAAKPKAAKAPTKTVKKAATTKK
jgi:hypothetical protein